MDPSDLVGYHFLVLRSFDPEVTEILCSLASGNDVFWDIGANKGTCSYAVAASLTACKIVAIEPQGTLAELTRANLHQLAHGRFEVHECGIGIQEESLTLNIPRSNQGRASFLPENFSDDSEQITVQIRTASQISKMSAFGPPTLVKIDVEGYEQFVIESLVPIIAARNCRAIVFENHHDKVAAFKTISKIAEDNRYKIYAIKKTPFSTKLHEATSTLDGSTDYVMIRDDICKSALMRFS